MAMIIQLIESRAREIKSLEGLKRIKESNELYASVLEYFSAGSADLTLDDVITFSRTALGMRAPDGPRTL